MLGQTDDKTNRDAIYYALANALRVRTGTEKSKLFMMLAIILAWSK